MNCPCRQLAATERKGMETSMKGNRDRKEDVVYGGGNVSASVGSLKIGDIQAGSGKRKAEKVDKKVRTLHSGITLSTGIHVERFTFGTITILTL
jgi:hypothetical protein